MSRPVHAQPSAQVSLERQELTRRAADLCRAGPAVFPAVVRLADELRAAGLEADEALWRVLQRLGQ